MTNRDGRQLYAEVKELVTKARKLHTDHNNHQIGQLAKQLRELLREYAKLRPLLPDRCFSLILFQTLRFPQELEWLPAFMKWAGLQSFRAEDYRAQPGPNDKPFEPLIETAARKVAKIALDSNDVSHKELAIQLIDQALDKAEIQAGNWLSYRKALLLHSLGQIEEAKQLLISFVKDNRNQYWAWHALAKVVGDSDRSLALALCAKACLTCHDLNFGVNVFFDLSRLAAAQGQTQLAKWAATQAFTIRNNNRWQIPQSLRELLNADWYAHGGILSDPDEVLTSIAANAEQVIWSSCPRYDANYLDIFTTANGKQMAKFGLFYQGNCQEISGSARDLLHNLNLVLGEPVTVTVDHSGDRLTAVVVKKRDGGQPFDQLERLDGILDNHGEGKAFVYLNPHQHCTVAYADFPRIQMVRPGTPLEVICARYRERINPYKLVTSTFVENANICLRIGTLSRHSKGFGFVEDVFVSPNLAEPLQEGQIYTFICVKKMNRKKNKLGWTAIALVI